MEHGPSNQWKFYLYGPFRVEGPTGTAVAFPTRKAAALLAILVLELGHVVPRATAASILWPESNSEKQNQNLRKALSHLREALGDSDLVEVTRTGFRLKPEFIWSDLRDAPDQSASGRILVDFVEPWFEETREIWETDAAVGDDANSPGHAFLGVLKWTVEESPRRAIDLMRLMSGLTLSLPSAEFYKIAHKTRAGLQPADREFGWAHYFVGFASLMGGGQLNEALTSLDQAIQHGQVFRDFELIAEAAHTGIGIKIIQGRADVALAQSQTLIEAARSQKLDQVEARVTHTAALAAFHLGDDTRGFTLLSEAERMPYFETKPHHAALLASHRALFEATSGSLDEALKHVASVIPEGPEYERYRLEATAEYTRALIAQRQNEPALAEKHYKRLLELGNRFGNTSFQIYAQEGLAIVAHREKDDVKSRALIEEAMHVRRQHQFGWTKWDQARVGTIKSQN